MAARRWWAVARRDEARVARRRSRQPGVAGVYRLDAGALLDDFVPVLEHVGVRAWLADVDGPALPRELGPGGPDVWRSGLKTRCGRERLTARPAWRGSAEALRRWGGGTAPQARQGGCQRGPATRQGERAPGPLGPDTLAQPSVQVHGRELEAGGHRAMRAVAQAGGFGAKVTGLADGTDRETTAREVGCGQGTRQVRLAATRGRGHAIEVTGDGGKVRLVSEATPTMPLAVKGGPMDAPATHGTRAWVTQARSPLAGDARRHQVVLDQGVGQGTARWGLDQHGLTWVVPATATMAVTADARAQAAAPADITRGRRGQTVRHGQGRGARTAQRETAGVGLTGLTPDAPEGTPAHGRYPHRRDVQPHALNAVVGRQWHGRDEGPGGKPVFLTNASVQPPLQPCDDDDDRRLIEHCWSNEAKQPWELGHPPQKTERAVRVHGVFTRADVRPGHRLSPPVCARGHRG